MARQYRGRARRERCSASCVVVLLKSFMLYILLKLLLRISGILTKVINSEVGFVHILAGRCA
jgi:hypothetical protein